MRSENLTSGEGAGVIHSVTAVTKAAGEAQESLTLQLNALGIHIVQCPSNNKVNQT